MLLRALLRIDVAPDTCEMTTAPKISTPCFSRVRSDMRPLCHMVTHRVHRYRRRSAVLPTSGQPVLVECRPRHHRGIHEDIESLDEQRRHAEWLQPVIVDLQSRQPDRSTEDIERQGPGAYHCAERSSL